MAVVASHAGLERRTGGVLKTNLRHMHGTGDHDGGKPSAAATQVSSLRYTVDNIVVA